MSLTVYADFSDPLSYLAHQRVQRLTGTPVDWRAVVADPAAPATGRRVAPADAEALAAAFARLARADERIPVLPAVLPHPGTLTAALAEAVSDGVDAALRAAVMTALWEDGSAVLDTAAVRRLIVAVMNPPASNVAALLPNTPMLALGDVDPWVPSRRSGGTISQIGGPMTTRAHRRVAAWHDGWRLRSFAPLPLVVTDLGEALPREHGLAYLAGLLPAPAAQELVTAA